MHSTDILNLSCLSFRCHPATKIVGTDSAIESVRGNGAAKFQLEGRGDDGTGKGNQRFEQNCTGVEVAFDIRSARGTDDLNGRRSPTFIS